MTAILMTVMLACNTDPNRYSSYHNISLDQGWAYTDTLTFIPLHADSVASGDYWICVRHSNNYPFANLWLELSYTDPDGNHHADTVNLTLADTYGNWQGQRLGLHYQHRVKAVENVRHLIGTPLKVRHIMRMDTLREIDLVGVEFL
ncbi:MAG: gliding motility lipoprotein GldH [Muribaculaceae bacterium]|nr:gliding motility lipoprotein GldH [Muribaculaceae bacterium]